MASERIDAETRALLQPWFPGLDLERTQLVHSGPVCWFVRRVLKQGAMTVAPRIFYGRARFDLSSRASVALLAHELRHLEQYARYGHAGFLLRYLHDLARARFHYSETLPLESEAYQLQTAVYDALAGDLPA